MDIDPGRAEYRTVYRRRNRNDRGRIIALTVIHHTVAVPVLKIIRKAIIVSVIWKRWGNDLDFRQGKNVRAAELHADVTARAIDGEGGRRAGRVWIIIAGNSGLASCRRQVSGLERVVGH